MSEVPHVKDLKVFDAETGAEIYVQSVALHADWKDGLLWATLMMSAVVDVEVDPK